MEISVVIPTHKRPEMLRSTLSSVACQSRLDLISEVIVSENGEDNRSSEVCDEFKVLPLRYVQRTPALEVLHHFKMLVSEARAPWVAWIADDDMWGRYHIEEARRCLVQIPELTAFFGGYACVKNNSCRIEEGAGPSLLGLSRTTEDKLVGFETWSFERVLLESLIRLPLNPWAMVCKKEHLLVALDEWRECEGGWDSDRYFLGKLAQRGVLALSREHTLFFRIHAKRATSTHTRDTKRASDGCGATSREIIKLSRQCGLDLKDKWITAIKSLSPEETANYFGFCRFMRGGLEEIERAWGKEAVPRGFRRSDFITGKTIVRSITPPIVWSLFSALKSSSGRGKP